MRIGGNSRSRREQYLNSTARLESGLEQADEFRSFIAVQRDEIADGIPSVALQRVKIRGGKTFARLILPARIPPRDTASKHWNTRETPSAFSLSPSPSPRQSLSRRPQSTKYLRITFDPAQKIQLDSIACIIDGVWSCHLLSFPFSACFLMRFVDSRTAKRNPHH